MYPYHYFHHAGRYRAPRFFWFLIGAGTATWFIRYKDANERHFGHCMRPSIQPPQLQPPQPQLQSQSQPQLQSQIPVPPTEERWNSPEPQRTFPPWASRNSWSSQPDHRLTSDERDKLAALSKQAADTMSDLTESTLDSVLNTAQALKQKLAEYRAQRELEQKQFEKELEEKRKYPPRLV